MTYAADTTISVFRTKADIEELLTKYGVTAFVTGWDAPQLAHLMFEYRERRYHIRLPIPQPDEERFQYVVINQYGYKRLRTPAQAAKEHAQAVRSQWRALLLLLKAKLVAVDQGLEPFEQMFLPHLLLNTPTGPQTLHEWVDPQVPQAYASGGPPALLPGAVGAPRYLPPPSDEHT